MACFLQKAGKRASDVVELPLQDVRLLKLLQCCKCGVFGPGPIWMCQVSHVTCHPCQVRLGWQEICPSESCGKPVYSRTYKLYEAFTNASTFYCDYPEKGCPEILLGRDYALHVAMCQFRPEPIGPPKRSSKIQKVYQIVKLVDPEYIEAQKKLPFITWSSTDTNPFGT